MTARHTTPAALPAKSGIVRRFAAAAIIGCLFFVVLWVTVFSAMNAALVSSGGVVVLVAGASASDVFESIFSGIADAVFAILGAIADFFSAIFDFFS
jgi:hypothetical protein